MLGLALPRCLATSIADLTFFRGPSPMCWPRIYRPCPRSGSFFFYRHAAGGIEPLAPPATFFFSSSLSVYLFVVVFVWVFVFLDDERHIIRTYHVPLLSAASTSGGRDARERRAKCEKSRFCLIFSRFSTSLYVAIYPGVWRK